MEVHDDPWDQWLKGNNIYQVVVKPSWVQDVVKHRGCVARFVARPGKVLKWACHCTWDPTAPMLGSQEAPGTTPATPQALPTSFWARV